MFWCFIAENWVVILAAAIIVSHILYLTITKQWTKVREFAYQAMLLAERTFSDEEGKVKFDFVVGVVYKYLPFWLRLFIKEEHIRNLIQAWYQTAKDFLDDGKINQSV